MKVTLNAALMLIAAISTVLAAPADQNDNAALRYWAAFSELRDSAVTAEQAKELGAIVDGTAPYDDSKYRELVEKNQLALEIMSRGTRFTQCDWGLDYDLGMNMPVEYVREALTLGRLNVLYTFHLLKGGNTEGVVQSLTAGLRFSHDVANGGTLLATMVAKSLLSDHLKAIVEVLRVGQVSADQRSRLQTAVGASGYELDWSSAARRDLELLRHDYARTPEAAAALDRVEATYLAAVSNEFSAASAELTLKTIPKDLANVIPNLEGVLKQKQDLSDRIRQTRAALQ